MKRKKTLSKYADVRPLNQRETKMDTRKGMIKVTEVVNIKWAEKEQLLFDNSQRNCTGYVPPAS